MKRKPMANFQKIEKISGKKFYLFNTKDTSNHMKCDASSSRSIPPANVI